MASGAKFNKVTKEKFLREEKERVVGIRPKRVYFLIVCEGEKTEPNYFKGLKEKLPNGTVVVADLTIQGAGKNTISLVDFTLNYIKTCPKRFDRIWVVFDKNSFTNRQFNSAILKAESNNIKVAWSNEAFELWFILHFDFINHSMSREDYQSHLEKAVSKRLKKSYEYKKNAENTYQILSAIGNEKRAISWAKKLDAIFEDKKYAEHNPCTKVYELLEELFNPEKVLKELPL